MLIYYKLSIFIAYLVVMDRFERDFLRIATQFWNTFQNRAIYSKTLFSSMVSNEHFGTTKQADVLHYLLRKIFVLQIIISLLVMITCRSYSYDSTVDWNMWILIEQMRFLKARPINKN